MDVVNKIKQNELLKWRQQQIAQTEGDYKKCLYEVGAAHLAAEHETEKMKRIDAQRAKNRKLALHRSKLAAEKVKAKRLSNGKGRAKETQVHTVATQVENLLSAESDSDAASSLSSLSSASSVCSVIVRKDKKEIPPMKFKSPGKGAKMKKAEANDYRAEKFISMNGSTSTDASLSIASPPVAKFTRVSDLLKKKSFHSVPAAPAAAAAKIQSVVTKPYVSKTFKLDKSGVEPRRSPIKKTIIKSVAARSGKSGATHPASLTVQPIKKKTPIVKKAPLTKYDIKPYVPQFIKSKRPTAASAAETATTSQKVQFYDHSNRFSKEYENKLDLIENYDATTPLNAMQEAEMERVREKTYSLEMAKAR